MLYITTRNDQNTFEVNHVLHEDIAPDGGRYVPYDLHPYDKDELSALLMQSFGQIVAEILNLFFGSQLTGWDVDFYIGRSTARVSVLNNKVCIAELWHNPASEFTYIVSHLYARIRGSAKADNPTEWFTIATRIAFFFAVYGELCKQGILSFGDPIDIALPISEMTASGAAWYARKMGLPINAIVSVSNQSSTMWDLIHRGEANVANEDPTIISGIERLIHGALGQSFVQEYLSAMGLRQAYTLDEENLPIFNNGLFCVVTSKERSTQTINSVYRTSGYILDSLSAVCFGGLQDYRAKTGENNQAIIISEHSPMRQLPEIAFATGLSETKITELINLS